MKRVRKVEKRGGVTTRGLTGWGRSITTHANTEMIVCQIVYNIVLHSNEFGTVSGRKEGINTESTEEKRHRDRGEQGVVGVMFELGKRSDSTYIYLNSRQFRLSKRAVQCEL